MYSLQACYFRSERSKKNYFRFYQFKITKNPKAQKCKVFDDHSNQYKKQIKHKLTEMKVQYLHCLETLVDEEVNPTPQSYVAD